jgi:ferredoxin
MVQDHIERQVGDLLIRIDRLLCVGFGDCIEVAPEVFEFDSEGIVRFRDDADAATVERARLITSCDICPVDALMVFDASGAQLVP